MNWTNELPKESGYYWYQSTWDGSRPEVVEFEIEGAMGTTITFCGNEIGCGGIWNNQIDGKFWPQKITPPQ